MADSRVWTTEHRTGGSLDAVLLSIQSRFPDVVVRRLVGTHPADDDNVFWVQRGGVEVQIDTASGGAPPFVVEGEIRGSRLDTSDFEAAREHVERLIDTYAR